MSAAFADFRERFDWRQYVIYVGFPMMFFCKDGFGGRSPGKALMGLHVLDTETLGPIGFGSSFKRNLPLLIPFMPLIVAVLLLKGHRIGDGWSRSRVVLTRSCRHPVFVGGIGRSLNPQTCLV